MKHGVDDSLIYLTADILIEKYPNTVNARWHKAKSVDVIEKTQNDWPDSEIYEIWTQKHRPISVILWFTVLHILPLKIISINIVTAFVKYPFWFSSLKY